ncbi:hypothetical protein BH11PLA1_BH11PLA1_22290 [soil metagenome]
MAINKNSLACWSFVSLFIGTLLTYAQAWLFAFIGHNIVTSGTNRSIDLNDRVLIVNNIPFRSIDMPERSYVKVMGYERLEAISQAAPGAHYYQIEIERSGFPFLSLSSASGITREDIGGPIHQYPVDVLTRGLDLSGKSRKITRLVLPIKPEFPGLLYEIVLLSSLVGASRLAYWRLYLCSSVDGKWQGRLALPESRSPGSNVPQRKTAFECDI